MESGGTWWNLVESKVTERWNLVESTNFGGID